MKFKFVEHKKKPQEIPRICDNCKDIFHVDDFICFGKTGFEHVGCDPIDVLREPEGYIIKDKNGKFYLRGKLIDIIRD